MYKPSYDRPNRPSREYSKRNLAPETYPWKELTESASGEANEGAGKAQAKRIEVVELVAERRGLPKSIAETVVGEAVHIGLLIESAEGEFVSVPIEPRVTQEVI